MPWKSPHSKEGLALLRAIKHCEVYTIQA